MAEKVISQRDFLNLALSFDLLLLIDETPFKIYYFEGQIAEYKFVILIASSNYYVYVKCLIYGCS